MHDEAGNDDEGRARTLSPLTVLLVAEPAWWDLRDELARRALIVRLVPPDPTVTFHAARHTPSTIALVAVASTVLALQLIATLMDAAPKTSIVTLGLPPSDADFLAVVRAGAVGYLPAHIAPDALVRALGSVAEGHSALPRDLTVTLAHTFHDGIEHLDLADGERRASLTPREWEVLQLVWQGRSTREIAERLFISMGTVRTHFSAICHKLDVPSSSDLLRLIDDRQPASSR